MAIQDQSRPELAARQAALVQMNITWLRQALDLVEAVDDEDFTASPRGMEPHRVGSHLRHVLEFYECFLDGLESSHIDYDARRRDERLAVMRPVAVARIESLIDRLGTDRRLRGDNVLFVRMEDSSSLGLADPYVVSSVGRELMTMSSHTIHHFALIAMKLRGHGYPVHPDFGVAPSTLRYMAEKRTKTVAPEAA